MKPDLLLRRYGTWSERRGTRREHFCSFFVPAIFFLCDILFDYPLIFLDLVCRYVITPHFSFVNLDVGGRVDGLMIVMSFFLPGFVIHPSIY